MSKEEYIPPTNNWVREPKSINAVYEFYILGEIETPECYIDMFDTIRNARDADIVKIYLNSMGGDLFTAIQFRRVMAETAATTVCSVEGACMSAATMIMLAADEVELSDNSSFMIHNYSSGAFGKGGRCTTRFSMSVSGQKTC